MYKCDERTWNLEQFYPLCLCNFLWHDHFKVEHVLFLSGLEEGVDGSVRDCYLDHTVSGLEIEGLCLGQLGVVVLLARELTQEVEVKHIALHSHVLCHAPV